VGKIPEASVERFKKLAKQLVTGAESKTAFREGFGTGA
jgi:hypothetical protein